jgi:DNA-directed RNA polymerase subunit RPC12/RpoP
VVADFRVLADNRLLFVCPSCSKRRIYPILTIQRSAIRCQSCGAFTRCVFKQRPVILRTREGKKIQVFLLDISSTGVGFEVQNSRDARALRMGQVVMLTCDWNPGLIPEARFIIKSISGYKIGVAKIT